MVELTLRTVSDEPTTNIEEALALVAKLDLTLVTDLLTHISLVSVCIVSWDTCTLTNSVQVLKNLITLLCTVVLVQCLSIVQVDLTQTNKWEWAVHHTVSVRVLL